MVKGLLGHVGTQKCFQEMNHLVRSAVAVVTGTVSTIVGA